MPELCRRLSDSETQLMKIKEPCSGEEELPVASFPLLVTPLPIQIQ